MEDSLGENIPQTQVLVRFEPLMEISKHSAVTPVPLQLMNDKTTQEFFNSFYML